MKTECILKQMSQKLQLEMMPANDISIIPQTSFITDYCTSAVA